MAVKENFPISHVLIDCENLGLKGLTDLVVKTDGTPLKFILFHNESNTWTLSLSQLKDVGYALNEDRVDMIELSIPDKMTKKQAENALDFYIAFYMGQIMSVEPESHCVILSKDHDYDPLILHVQKQFGKDRCERIDSYEELAKTLGLNVKVAKPAEKKAVAQEKAETPLFDLQKAMDKAMDNILRMPEKTRPTTIKKLKNAMKSVFSAEPISDDEMQQLVEGLQKSGHIAVSANGNKIEKYL